MNTHPEVRFNTTDQLYSHSTPTHDFTCQQTSEHHLALIRRMWGVNHRCFHFITQSLCYNSIFLVKIVNQKICSSAQYKMLFLHRPSMSNCAISTVVTGVTVNIFAASGHKYFSPPPPNPILGSVPVCPNVVFFSQPSAAAAFFSLQSSQQHNPLHSNIRRSLPSAALLSCQIFRNRQIFVLNIQLWREMRPRWGDSWWLMTRPQQWQWWTAEQALN